MIPLTGERSVVNMGDLPHIEHEKVRSIYVEALGSKAILSLKPLVEATLKKYMEVWRGYAERGEV